MEKNKFISIVLAILTASNISITAFAGQWEPSGEDWRYKNDNGDYATGWQWIDGKSYYFGEDGTMAKDTVVDGFQVNADGQWTVDGVVQTNEDSNSFYKFTTDEQGNLYFVNEKGEMLKDQKNENGLYFDENGVYISPAYDPDGKKKEMAEKFAAREYVTFENEDEMLDFLEYYQLQEHINGDLKKMIVNESPDGSCGLRMQYANYYDRDGLKKRIIEELGPVTGETIEECIGQAFHKVTEKFEYDINYKYVSMEQALTDGRGVCWHMAKAAKVLLEDAGIYTETMSGKYYEGDHMWIRCWDGEKWIYSDPSNFRQVIHYVDFTDYYDTRRVMSFNRGVSG